MQDILPPASVLFLHNAQNEHMCAIDELNTLFNHEGGLDSPSLRERATHIDAIKCMFTYSLQPNHELVNFEGLFAIHPDDDAFTASLKYIVRTFCAMGRLSAGKCYPESSMVTY